MAPLLMLCIVPPRVPLPSFLGSFAKLGFSRISRPGAVAQSLQGHFLVCFEGLDATPWLVGARTQRIARKYAAVFRAGSPILS